jgi:hypothetical protein
VYLAVFPTARRLMCRGAHPHDVYLAVFPTARR